MFVCLWTTCLIFADHRLRNAVLTQLNFTEKYFCLVKSSVKGRNKNPLSVKLEREVRDCKKGKSNVNFSVYLTK
jgi:glutathione peroxidase-family protein